MALGMDLKAELCKVGSLFSRCALMEGTASINSLRSQLKSALTEAKQSKLPLSLTRKRE